MVSTVVQESQPARLKDKGLRLPYLSIVVAARNDDYGGDFLRRFRVFRNALLAQAADYPLDAELIIVEWNPPANRPRLANALDWPSSHPSLRVRIVEVPSEIHATLPNADRLPMFEFIAKNAGILRSRGQFVLATNPDIILSNELLRFLASRRLSEDCFYRVDRHDVSVPIPEHLHYKDQLQLCTRHVCQVLTYRGIFAVEQCPNRLGLQLAWHARYWWTRLRNKPMVDFWMRGLHTKAAGDFMLLARSRWNQFRGYPEMKSHMYIDGYSCFMAAACGLRQRLLGGNLRIFHQEHSREEHASRPRTNYDSYRKEGREMLASVRSPIVNDKSWGLGLFRLREETVTSLANNPA